MKTHEFFTEYFKHELVPTEYTAYQLLIKYPIDADINYLAVPWSLCDSITNSSGLGTLVPRNKWKQLSKIRIKGGFTICQHISYKNIIPILKEIGITTLFTPHAYGRDSIEVLPFPHLAINGVDPASKNILYSFVGCSITHRTRRVICNMLQQPDVIIKCRGTWHYEIRDRADNTKEYINILSRSRFALCPRGTGAGIIRFWEALQAGAIPILISDDMQLPQKWDWGNTIIRVRESDAGKVDKIVRSVPIDREEILRNNCLSAFKEFSGLNFVNTIRCRFKA